MGNSESIDPQLDELVTRQSYEHRIFFPIMTVPVKAPRVHEHDLIDALPHDDWLPDPSHPIDLRCVDRALLIKCKTKVILAVLLYYLTLPGRISQGFIQ